MGLRHRDGRDALQHEQVGSVALWRKAAAARQKMLMHASQHCAASARLIPRRARSSFRTMPFSRGMCASNVFAGLVQDMTLHPGRISTASWSGAWHCLCLGIGHNWGFCFSQWKCSSEVVSNSKRKSSFGLSCFLCGLFVRSRCNRERDQEVFNNLLVI